MIVSRFMTEVKQISVNAPINLTGPSSTICMLWPALLPSCVALSINYIRHNDNGEQPPKSMVTFWLYLAIFVGISTFGATTLIGGVLGLALYAFDYEVAATPLFLGLANGLLGLLCSGLAATGFYFARATKDP